MSTQAYVGRQAIFDRDHRVVGYELLYRDSLEDRAGIANAEEASAATIVHALLPHGRALAGDVPVWIKVPPSFLVGDLPILLAPERTVIEVVPSVRLTPQLHAGVRKLRDAGYRIALDAFTLEDPRHALLDVAEIVKLDASADADVRTWTSTLRPRVGTLVAEKVSTRAAWTMLRELGFDHFQGHYLESPVTTRTERMPHNRAALLRLLIRIYDERATLGELERLLAAEVGLTLSLFRLASSAAYSVGPPIASLAQVIARLGTQHVAALVMLLVASGFDDTPPELLRRALVRAKLSEGLARIARVPPSELFTAGLLTMLCAVLDQPLDRFVDELPVTDLIRDLLRGTPAGDASRVLAAAHAQERADFRAVSRSGFPAPVMFVAWYEAVRWTDELFADLRSR